MALRMSVHYPSIFTQFDDAEVFAQEHIQVIGFADYLLSLISPFAGAGAASVLIQGKICNSVT